MSQRNSFCVSIHFIFLLCWCCLLLRWVQLTERRGHRLWLMKSNVLYLPDVSCATDDIQRCCWPAYISAELFLKLFTFGQTSRSYLTNASEMRRLLYHRFLSSATLLCLAAGLRVWFPRCFVVLQAEFQSQPWLRAAEESVHEGHGRPAVAPEPAHKDAQEVRGGCQRGRLLPVSIFIAIKTEYCVCVWREQGCLNNWF